MEAMQQPSKTTESASDEDARVLSLRTQRRRPPSWTRRVEHEKFLETSTRGNEEKLRRIQSTIYDA